MTPRERWLALLAGQSVDRLPTDYWATEEFHQALSAALDCHDDEALWRRLQIDRPRFFFPQHKSGHHPDDPQADIWGCRRRQIDYGTGAYDEVDQGPLADVQAVEQVMAFRWPEVDDLDFAPMAAALDADDGYRIRVGGDYEPFLIYAAMRGMEQAYEDLLLAPEIAEAALERIFAYHYQVNQRIFEIGAGRIDMMYLAEDLGGQTGPLFGLPTYRRFLLPNQQRMAKLARSFGVHIFYHTDGAASSFLPDLVNEVGIEILNPIQWRCPGMDRETLAQTYGSSVVFHGGIDNQHTLPFATPPEVAEEVTRTAHLFDGCRWICAPCHNIQPNTPVKNVIAMYETANEIAARP